MNDATFRLKICGVRTAEDVDHVADAGGDAVGLNLYPASVRYVDPQSSEASDIVRRAHQRDIAAVAVVVERSPREVLGFHESLGFDAIQWHGDQRLEAMSESAREFSRSPVAQIRAIKLPPGKLTPARISDAVDPWLNAGFEVLLDADVGAAHGGQGQRLDWDGIGQWARQRPEVPFVLAGGLNPDSVADAISQSSAPRVDVASGVEQPRGSKNAGLIEAFCHAASQAWSIGRALETKGPRLN